jgi:serine protease AprX
MLPRTLVVFALLIAAAGSAAGGDLQARVIIQTLQDSGTAGSVDALVRACGGRVARRFRAVSALLADVPRDCLGPLAEHPEVRAVSADRPVHGALQQTTRTSVGAAWVVDRMGFDGNGVGVAIVDSGAAAWHDDLGSRVVHFADFVNRQTQPYDDYGHGTHVAGIIAGTGSSANGGRRGIAPGAHLVVLKALDGAGDGNVSHVIAAIDYAVRHRTAHNIRVLNLSVAAAVQESYQTDPLTQAARRAVEAGIVVITAAGNLGRDFDGGAQYGGITAPGNAPWVLTVGASNDHGTVSRRDDTVAAFSSRGPSPIDGAAKPDILAPGVAIESLGDPASLLYATRPAARRWGTSRSGSEPYLTLSGTSMAAPIVAGTVALMLQANPALSPDAVRTILQRTAENNGKYDQFTQGAGFLNARAAVEHARSLAAGGVAPAPDDGGTQ